MNKLGLYTCLVLLLSGLNLQKLFAKNMGNAEENGFGLTGVLAKPQKFRLGFQVSPTISWVDISHNELQTDGATITGGFGLHAEYSANKLFALVSGVNFNLPGGHTFDNASLEDTTTQQNFLLKYYTIEIPLMAKIKTLPIKNVIYYVQGGISAGACFDAFEVHRPASSLHDKKTVAINELTNSFLMNYAFGLGLRQHTIRSYALFAEVNFKQSILNIASKNGYENSGRYPTYPVPEISGGNMVFTIGVLF